jgi:hypothetical protein
MNPAAPIAAFSGPAVQTGNPSLPPVAQDSSRDARRQKAARSAWGGLRPYLIGIVIAILLALLILSRYLG